MIKSLTYLILVVFLCSCDDNPESILLKSSIKLSEFDEINYKVDYKFKSFDSKDTIILKNQDVLVQKIELDTILGYYATIEDSLVRRVYNGDVFDFVLINQKKLLRDYPNINGPKFTRNNINKDLIPSFFTRKNPFKRYAKEALDLKITDTVISGIAHWKMLVDLPVSGEITKMKRQIFIDKKSFLPTKIEYFATYLDIQTEYKMLDIEYRKLEKKIYTPLNKSYSPESDFIIEYLKKPEVNKNETLKINMDAPLFEGFTLNNSSFNLSNSISEDNLILLDFWYMGCAPCLKLMPELAKISEKYKGENITVIGVNPIDDLSTSKEEVEAFLSSKQINYLNVFVDREVPKNYKVNMYPTLLMIKKGKIIKIHSGYSANFLEELEFNIKNLNDE